MKKNVRLLGYDSSNVRTSRKVPSSKGVSAVKRANVTIGCQIPRKISFYDLDILRSRWKGHGHQPLSDVLAVGTYQTIEYEPFKEICKGQTRAKDHSIPDHDIIWTWRSTNSSRWVRRKTLEVAD